MSLKTVLSCPLGHKCQEAVDGEIRQCAWYTKMVGVNPNTGEEMDEHACAMTWLPVLLVENARTNRGTSAAIESFRNEMTQANEQTTAALIQASQLKLVNQK